MEEEFSVKREFMIGLAIGLSLLAILALIFGGYCFALAGGGQPSSGLYFLCGGLIGMAIDIPVSIVLAILVALFAFMKYSKDNPPNRKLLYRALGIASPVMILILLSLLIWWGMLLVGMFFR